MDNCFGGGGGSMDPTGGWEISCSPGGSEIVYTDDIRQFFGIIWKININGQNLVQLTTTDFLGASSPTWSPDANVIVFDYFDYSIGEYGKRQIYKMNSDGSFRENLSFNTKSEHDPSWYPGPRIVFVSDGELWTMDENGQNRIQITYDGSNKSDPEWSPNGNEIVWVKVNNPHKEIWICNADGTNCRFLYGYENIICSEPTFSFDGSSIIFIRKENGGNGEIWIKEIDGSYLDKISRDSDKHYGSPSLIR